MRDRRSIDADLIDAAVRRIRERLGSGEPAVDAELPDLVLWIPRMSVDALAGVQLDDHVRVGEIDRRGVIAAVGKLVREDRASARQVRPAIDGKIDAADGGSLPRELLQAV